MAENNTSGSRSLVRLLADALLRPVLRGVHHLLRLSWFVQRSATRSAHAFAFTRENRLVLVKLRYAEGWRLPGGARSSRESAPGAVIRELREEIGLTTHGRVEFAGKRSGDTNGRTDHSTLLIVRDVEYQTPRWSLEVEEAVDWALDELPNDLADTTAELLQTYLPAPVTSRTLRASADANQSFFERAAGRQS
jgi:8-oxo-dGTP pyrophosphatase MutT (NUDIX family)